MGFKNQVAAVKIQKQLRGYLARKRMFSIETIESINTEEDIPNKKPYPED